MVQLLNVFPDKARIPNFGGIDKGKVREAQNADAEAFQSETPRPVMLFAVPHQLPFLSFFGNFFPPLFV